MGVSFGSHPHNNIKAQPITNGEAEKESLNRYMVSGGLSNLLEGENIV
jgi:hypothetical protein